MPVSQNECRNLLLRALEPQDFALLAPLLLRVDAAVGEVVAHAGEPIEHICFPEGGIVSFADVLSDGSRIGIGHLGYEGLTGWPALLGASRSPHEACVTVAGDGAWRVESEPLRKVCRESETLNALLLRFVQAFVTQLGRTVVSNLTQPIEQRLCRWILMGHDRLEGDDIEVTHNEIGVMLGVRRASVTDTLHILEGMGLIRSRRGCVTVLDRPGLRARAGETYGFAEAEYSRLIAPFGKPD